MPVPGMGTGLGWGLEWEWNWDGNGMEWEHRKSDGGEKVMDKLERREKGLALGAAGAQR